MFNSIKNLFSGGDKKQKKDDQKKSQKPASRLNSQQQQLANDDDDDADNFQQFSNQAYMQQQMPMQQQQAYIGGPPMRQIAKITPELDEWRMVEDRVLPTLATEAQKTGQVELPPLTECIQIGAKFEYTKLLASKDSKKMPVMVSINETKINDLEQDTCKADIVCVIDVSGSMSGAKLENVKTTIKLLLELLEGSRIAIVTFGTSSQLYMNFKTINSDTTAKITLIVDSLRDLDSTNITAGVHEAQNLLGSLSNEIMFDNDYERTKTEYTLHSFGYGDDHDAKLMQSMSERKGGNYYFVQDIKRVDECFVDCLGMVTTMLANRGKIGR